MPLELPIELWCLILDFAALDHSPSTLFAFYQINSMTRAILANPNHKHWIKALKTISPPVFTRQLRVYYAWMTDRTYLARTCLRVVLFDKCMMCDACDATKFYWNFGKRLCFTCLHRYTIDEPSSRIYFGVRNAYKVLPFETLCCLLVINPTTSPRRNSFYWSRDYLRFIEDASYDFEINDSKSTFNTPERYMNIKEKYLKSLHRNDSGVADIFSRMHL